MNKVSETEETPALEHPSYEELASKLTEMEAKANEYWDKLLRQQAELENQRRRAERELENAYRYNVEKLVLELLPIRDGLEDALKISDDSSEALKRVLEGVELTLKMLHKVFDKFGVKQIDPVGEVFNPTLHEAMLTQEHESAAPNTVLSVLQKGYQLHDRLIRPARVIVAKAKVSP